jgi:hypothetical protein
MKTLLATCTMTAMLLGASVGLAKPPAPPLLLLPSGAQRAADADADSGYLDVASDPPGAQILIDGADTGKTTPQPKLPLKAGHHKLTVSLPGGASRSIGFKVEAGQTTKLTIHLAS